LSASPTARHRESFWLTEEDTAALAVMAGAEAKNYSEKVRDLIREAWARWPANQPQVGAIPQVEASDP